MADVARIKAAAVGRWPEILSALGGCPLEILDGQHHPCPKCGGMDRFRMIDAEAGAVYCNQCFSQDNGDGIAALQWATGRPFPDVLAMLADHLGLQNGNGRARNSHAGRKKKAADEESLTKGIKPVDHAPEIIEAFLAEYSQAKPPITPKGIKQCGGSLVRWCGYRCIRLDGRAPIDNSTLTAVVLLRADGTLFPAAGRIGERKTHTVKGSVNSWLASGDVATAETILDVEGVTDLLAVASTGLPQGWGAVTNTSGAKARGKLPRPWAAVKKIIVVGDADEPGQEGTKRCAAAYYQAGASEVLSGQLPYQIEKDHGKDLRDWLLEGHKLANLLTVAVSAEEAAAWASKTRPAADRPRVCAQDQDLEKITAEVWQAVRKANDPERLFRYGGNPCRIERDDEGNPITRTLDQDRMRYELARCVEWYKKRWRRRRQHRVTSLSAKGRCSGCFLQNPTSHCPFLLALWRRRFSLPMERSTRHQGITRPDARSTRRPLGSQSPTCQIGRHSEISKRPPALCAMNFLETSRSLANRNAPTLLQCSCFRSRGTLSAAGLRRFIFSRNHPRGQGQRCLSNVWPIPQSADPFPQ